MLRTALIVALICLPLSFAIAEESAAVDRKAIPEKVLAAFDKAYPDAKVTAIEMEKDGDAVAYSFEVLAGEKEKDIVYLADGTLREIAEDIAVAELPKAVADAVEKAHPKGVIDEADRITRGAETEYEVVVEMTEGDTETEYGITLTSGGKIIDDIQYTGDDEESGDDEEDSDSPGDEEDAN